jgi:hypothetical protein
VLHMHFARLCRASACVARSKPSGWLRVPTSHFAVGHVTMCGNEQTPGCLSGSWVSEEGGCRVPCSESPKRGNISLRESADSIFRGLVRRCLLSHPSQGDAATSNGRKRAMAMPLLAETCAHHGRLGVTQSANLARSLVGCFQCQPLFLSFISPEPWPGWLPSPSNPYRFGPPAFDKSAQGHQRQHHPESGARGPPRRKLPCRVSDSCRTRRQAALVPRTPPVKVPIA